MTFHRTEPPPEEHLWVDLRGTMTVITDSTGYIADGVLYAISEEGRPIAQIFGDTYVPSRHPELPTEFARLRSASDKGIIDFCRAWGHPYEVPTKTADVRREASRVWLILEMLFAYSRKDEERAKQLVEIGLSPPTLLPEFPVEIPEWTGAWWTAPVRPEFESPEWDGRRPPEDVRPAWAAEDETDPFALTSYVEIVGGTVATFVNDGMRWNHPVIFFEGKAEGFSLEIAFRNLVDVIYWHVGNMTASTDVGSADLRKCKECGTVFPATRKDQIFCPPGERLAKSKSGRTWSRCGDRYRKREMRRSETKEKSS